MFRLLRQYRLEIVASILCLSLGIASGWVGQSAESDWYLNLHKPSFNPPGWVFGPVWSILYIMMGIVLAKIWRVRQQYPALLSIFVVQFILNLIWSSLFFRLQRIDWALLDLALLWVSLLVFMTLARKLRTVYLLMIPYVLWVSFALALNVSIFKLNVMH